MDSSILSYILGYDLMLFIYFVAQSVPASVLRALSVVSSLWGIFFFFFVLLLALFDFLAL